MCKAPPSEKFDSPIHLKLKHRSTNPSKSSVSSRREDDFLALFLSRGFAEFTFDNGDGVSIVR